ncbi:MAG: Na(+)-translocating NADH-quinone reductase subunit C [Acidobacteriota bacterium]
MPPLDRNSYTVGFAAAICVICAVLVAGAAVSLAERQAANEEIDRQRNVLLAAGEMRPDEVLSAEEIAERFRAFQPVAVDLRTGQEDPSFDLTGYDQQAALANPQTSYAAPPNGAQVTRLPNRAVAYKKLDADGRLEMLVLPIEGKGLWSTMYGFLALDADLRTIRGITFYQHGETPGLGGEIDNPRWKAVWENRLAFDESGEPAIEVIRGRAGPADRDPHRIDGISGATITGRGVERTVNFWLGEHGFGPYLAQLKEAANGGAEG